MGRLVNGNISICLEVGGCGRYGVDQNATSHAHRWASRWLFYRRYVALRVQDCFLELVRSSFVAIHITITHTIVPEQGRLAVESCALASITPMTINKQPYFTMLPHIVACYCVRRPSSFSCLSSMRHSSLRCSHVGSQPSPPDNAALAFPARASHFKRSLSCSSRSSIPGRAHFPRCFACLLPALLSQDSVSSSSHSTTP